MTISTRCTSCGKQIELADKWEGEIYTCTACHKSFTVRDQSTLPDWSMIVEQAKSSAPAGAASASVADNRIGQAMATVPHAGLSPGGQVYAVPHRKVTMDFGMGDDSSVAMGLIFLGYGSAIVLQLVDLTNQGVLGQLPLIGWLFLFCAWAAMFATVAPITNIGMQLAGKMLGESFGPTLFRMYGLLAIPPAVGFLTMLFFGRPGMLIGILLGLLLMAPGMWVMYGLGGTNTLVAFLMSAVFFVLGLIVYAGVLFVLVLVLGLMGMAGKTPTRAPSTPPGFHSSQPTQPAQPNPLFHQPGFSAPPPLRTIEQKQYTLIDSTDAAVKVLSESDPAERRRALTYLAGLDISKIPEAARYQVGQAIKERLDDTELDIASRAGPMLAQWSSALAVDTFSRRLEDASPVKRSQAMNLLVELGDKNAIKPIVARLVDDNPAATAALAKFGKDAEPDIITALDSEQPEMRRAAMRVLQTIATQACVSKIKSLAGDPDATIASASRALWKKLEPATFDPITEAVFLLDSSLSTDRIQGLKLLADADFDSDRAKIITPKVEQLLSDDISSVAMAAAKATGKYHRDELARELADWFDEPTDDAVRRKVAMLAVGNMKHVPSAPQLVKWLTMEPQASVQALVALGPGAEPAILAVMPARDDAAMLGACAALEQIGSRRSLILLNSVSQTRGNAEVRAAAKQARLAILERLKAESPAP